MFPIRKLTSWPTFTPDVVTALQKFEAVWGEEMLQSAHSRAEKWSRNLVLVFFLDENLLGLLICFGIGKSNQAETRIATSARDRGVQLSGHNKCFLKENFLKLQLLVSQTHA